jgi:Asp-tRNA(Asn)/Glu-tRNA(Gln) amidotransferase A subunit family amidase
VAQGGFLDVAVPSRLKFRSSTLPLAGLRVAVKDNFHLKGIKTSLCNRAYYEIYPPPSATAFCIQQLIDLGAIVLGKTKLNSFGTWEEPTEYVDYQAPWNPRADGYQSPGGSSSGSGAAVGAYDWIDIAIGSDSKLHALTLFSVFRVLFAHSICCIAGGSISRPGLWNGCFALRPSLGAVPVEGLVASIRCVVLLQSNIPRYVDNQ